VACYRLHHCTVCIGGNGDKSLSDGDMYSRIWIREFGLKQTLLKFKSSVGKMDSGG